MLNRNRGSGGGDGKALQTDGGDGDPVGMRSVPLNRTLGNGEGGELHVPRTSPPHKQPKLFQIFLFIYFYLGGCAVCAFSGCNKQGLLSTCGVQASSCSPSSCGRGFTTPRHAGSSCTRDRTRVLCIGRRILNHRTTREVPRLFFQLYKSVTAALSLELKPPISGRVSY